MTDSTKTHILMISDRSGSMHAHRSDTEGGINTFLDVHRAAPGHCDITFVQFDDHYEVVYEGDLRDMPKYILTPRGSTSLLDAIGRGVTQLGEKLARTPEDQRPADVLCVISTDGYENSSREWRDLNGGPSRIKALLEQQRNQWQWQIVFLGANIDAIAVGAAYGIPTASTVTFDQANVGGTYAMAATNTANYRSARALGQSVATASSALNFTDEQREQAIKKDDDDATSDAQE